jgi:hypothetical protein
VFLCLSPRRPPAPAAKPAFTEAQLQDGLRSGLTTLATQAIKAGSIKVPVPSFMAKLRTELTTLKKADVLDRFEFSLAAATRRLEPKVLDEIRKAIRAPRSKTPARCFSADRIRRRRL